MRNDSAFIRRATRKGVVALAFLAPLPGYALGFRIPNQDAEATARGNAYVATADNPSAVYYNPAGITQLKGQYFQYGLHSISVNSEYTSFGGQRATTKFEALPVPQIYYTQSLKDTPFSAGLGIYAPWGLGLQWFDNPSFRTLAIEGRLLYVSFNPVLAWEALPNLSIAAGPAINYSQLKLNQAIGLTAGDQFHFRAEDFAFGFTAGLLWKVHPQWSLGATYRSASTMNYDGHSVLSPYASETKTTAAVDFPQVVAAGISFRPTPAWNFEVDVDWTDWDTLNTVVFKGVAGGDLPFPLNWHSSFMYHAGASRYFENGYFVSAGYFYSANSTSDTDFTPYVPDTNLHVGSLGFGYKGPRWRWALSGQIITGPSRTVSGSSPHPASPVYGPQTADGTYHWFNQAVNFSIGYHF